MAKDKNKVGIHGTDAETGRDKAGEKVCVITAAQFHDKAPAAVEIKGVAVKKTFSPDAEGKSTLGYFGQITAMVMVDGIPVEMKGNAMLYITNSKFAK